MNRRTFYFCAWLSLMGLSSCKQTDADRYRRYLEEVADTAGMEFITPTKDTIVVDEVVGDDPFGDDDGLVAIPDIPQDHVVDMNGNNYELEKIMRGGE